MNTESQTIPPATPPKRRIFNRQTVVAFIAGAAMVVGVGAWARAGGMGGWHHGSVMDGKHSPAEVDAHVDHMLKFLYVEIDATDAQKAQISPLVKAAVRDLLPLQPQMRAVREQVVQSLTQTTIDRATLESVRQQQMQLADQASKRIVQLVGDLGDVLTPAQRQELAEHLQKMRGMPRS